MAFYALKSGVWQEVRISTIMALIFNGLGFVASVIALLSGDPIFIAGLIGAASLLYTVMIGLALARKGIASQVIEQAAEFKEIGAGIQLGPNVFWMFDILGLIEPISALAVFPNNLIMMDSITGEEGTRISLGVRLIRPTTCVAR